MSPTHQVLATCRLQLHAGFTFAAARAAVPYLARMGVTHVYASPVLRARAGSPHGYDVTDPAEVNPELGGEDGFRALVAELRRHGMGLVLDIVPNHMAAVRENPYWQEVLTHGRDAPHAHWFDVDWEAGGRGSRGRVLLPVLEDWFPRVLESGALAVDWSHGRFHLRHGEARFPTDPMTAGLILDGLQAPHGSDGPELAAARAIAAELRALLPPRAAKDRAPADARQRREQAGALLDRLGEAAERSPAVGKAVAAAAARFGGEDGAPRLRRFLDRQPYALVHWRRARAELNYRRFFDVNDLVALRVEDPAVFEETHAKVLAWAGEGLLDGLRVDHVDGLLDPLGYLRRLSAALARRARGPCPVWVEKILAPGERLPEPWPVAGTTGYEFLNLLESVFLDPDGVAAVEECYRAVTGRTADFAASARRGKRAALTRLLATDLHRLSLRLRRLARRRSATSRLRRFELAGAIVEVIVHLPVYRTYVDGRPGSPRPEDRTLVARALGGARAGRRASHEALAFLEELLLLREPVPADPGTVEPADGPPSAAGDAAERLRFVLRFQQTSGPAAAKGVEDTALYVHVPLLSRNEVGGSPDAAIGDAVVTLHRENAERARRWPGSLLCTSTHDTKRSGDVRARLDVLSEVPGAWRAALTRWQGWSRRRRRPLGGRLAPSRNDMVLLQQSLVGVWPLPRPGAAPAELPSVEERAGLRERLAAYALKAAREAKLRTSWIETNAAYEEALTAFAEALVPEGPSRFLEDVAAFVAEIARPGLWNALARTVVHLTAPGVPDLYQGDELWTFSLVDPDNRRPVDYALRRRLLASLDAEVGSPPDAVRLRPLVSAPEDGRLKLHVTRAALHARRRRPRLFLDGGYVPLAAEGAAARHVVAFARIGPEAGEAAIVAVPRLPRTLVGNGRDAPVGAVWADTRLILPAVLAGLPWASALDGRRMEARSAPGGRSLPLADLLDPLPAALLLSPR